MSTNDLPVTLAVSKGSLEENALKLLRESGLGLADVPSNQYIGLSEDPRFNVVKMRPRNIVERLRSGKLDMAIVGSDILQDKFQWDNPAVQRDLAFISRSSRPMVDWVLAVRDGAPWQNVFDFLSYVSEREGRTRIASELTTRASQYFAQLDRALIGKLEYEESDGATEVLTQFGADAIIDISDSGDTLRVNRLRSLGVLYRATGVLCAQRGLLADSGKYADRPQSSAAARELRDNILGAVRERGFAVTDPTLCLDLGSLT